MGEKKLPKFLTLKAFREEIVPWSDDTIRRKIKDNGLPAIQDEGGRYLIPTEEALLWFKRRRKK